MKRRTLLRDSALALTTVVGLAGCTGDGGGDGGGSTTTRATAEPTPTTTEPTATTTEATTTSGGEERGDLGDPMGEVGETPDGLTVVELASFVEGEGDSSPFTSEGEWATRVTIENVGGQEADLIEERYYSYGLTVYDDAGTELYGGGAGVGSTDGSTLPAGETSTVTLVPAEDVDPDRIARYVVSITCGSFSQGVYCE